jgi:hypothetical protein
VLLLLLHAVNPIGPSIGPMNNNGVMGSSPVDGVVNTSTDSLPQQHQGDCSNNSSPAHSFHHGGSQCGGSDSEPRRHWMPKMDFPRFDGSDVRIWLDKCATYFQLYAIPHDFRVTATSLHMVDRASHWFQTYKHSVGIQNWEHFVGAVTQAFEVNTHRVKTIELLNLHQTGSVEDYKLKFDQLVYHILLYDNSLSETMLVSQFLLGLKEDLRQAVEMHLPDTVAQVATLADVQEHLNEKYKHSTMKSYVVKSDTKSGGVPPDLWKARQLKEFRRANNLCFKCGEKYSPTHTCKTPKGTLHMMDQSTSNGGGFLSNEVLNTLEQSHLHLLQDDCYLSLHTLSGAPQHRAIQQRALIRNQALVILVDSGSSHTFLNSVLADKLQVAVSPLPLCQSR